MKKKNERMSSSISGRGRKRLKSPRRCGKEASAGLLFDGTRKKLSRQGEVQGRAATRPAARRLEKGTERNSRKRRECEGGKMKVDRIRRWNMGWANRMGQVGTWGEGEEIRPDQNMARNEPDSQERNCSYWVGQRCDAATQLALEHQLRPDWPGLAARKRSGTPCRHKYVLPYRVLVLVRSTSTGTTAQVVQVPVQVRAQAPGAHRPGPHAQASRVDQGQLREHRRCYPVAR